MDSELGTLAFLVAVAGGLFLLITLLVLVSGRRRGGTEVADGILWFGGPAGSEHGVSRPTLVLTGRRALGAAPEVDWPRLAETAEPGRHIGGASAGW